MWTMLDGFQHLNGTEIDDLVQAPVLITILIGAADGELDMEERTWSDRLLHARTYSKHSLLNDYYRVVSEGFMDKMDKALISLPQDTEARNLEIAGRLGRLNLILPKLDIHLAAALYKSFVALASETAKASGGFLRIGAVSAVEQLWVKLPMITPVLAPKKQEQPEDTEEE